MPRMHTYIINTLLY